MNTSRLRLCSIILWTYQEFWLFPSLFLHRVATSDLALCPHTIVSQREKREGALNRGFLFLCSFFIREKNLSWKPHLRHHPLLFHLSELFHLLNPRHWLGKGKLHFLWLVYTNYYGHFVFLRAGRSCSLNKIMVQLEGSKRLFFWINKADSGTVIKTKRWPNQKNINALINASGY